MLPMKRIRSGALVLLALLLVGCDPGGGSDRGRGLLYKLDPEAQGTGGTPAAGEDVALPPDNPSGAYLFGLGTRLLVSPYTADAPRTEAMMHCTVTLREGEECNLEQLPLIGMVHPDPSIDEVMERVLVSHHWMGQRFREVLEALPPDILKLTRALTAIVISYDIRPSFYTQWTGAIYLDPDDLWLTQAERSVVSTAPDYRSSFGDALAFTTLWRYVKHNEYATRPPTEGTRTIEDIRYAMASLLYHELAHANDYFYPGKNYGALMQVPIYQAAGGTIPSRELTAQYPLRSVVLAHLGAVRYLGFTATTTDKAYTPDDVAGEFENDYASAFYSYASEREDLAMLFEELMMLYNFDIDRDVAVTNNPDSGQCADYLVAWGQRNRILDTAVGHRALFIAQKVIPEVAPQLEAFLDARYETERQMTQGVDWCTNRYLDPAPLGQPPETRALGLSTVETVDPTIPYL